MAGIGVGTLALPPLTSRLIAATDWRTAYVALGLVVAALDCTAALLIEQSPQRRGLLPDGASPSAGTPDQETGGRDARRGGEVTLRLALRSRPFWLLYAAAVATGLA